MSTTTPKSPACRECLRLIVLRATARRLDPMSKVARVEAELERHRREAHS
ncbi:hypothetical protein ACFP1Z_17725 [Streptomyces gamaensis]|uniref:Uncharacterized protein n=1 Tax=Streptomyces gamaensis TaxID=1763542 RepID=A0ABW0Z6G2_9ACTN